jgi:hypothetical protein
MANSVRTNVGYVSFHQRTTEAQDGLGGIDIVWHGTILVLCSSSPSLCPLLQVKGFP